MMALSCRWFVGDGGTLTPGLFTPCPPSAEYVDQIALVDPDRVDFVLAVDHKTILEEWCVSLPFPLNGNRRLIVSYSESGRY